MTEEQPPFVARSSDIDALGKRWEQSRAGVPQLVRLQAPFGGGRRALVTEFLRPHAQDSETLVWRVTCLAEENGLQWLIRMYGSLMASLTQDVVLRGRVEMLLNTEIPKQPKRVQEWFQQFIQAMKESETDNQAGKVKLSLPKDNPVIGLVEVIAAISRKMPVVLDLQNVYVVHSVLPSMFLDALYNESKPQGCSLLIVLSDEPESDTRNVTHPSPLIDFYTRESEGIVVQSIAPWTGEEVGQFLSSKGLSKDNADAIAQLGLGRPGFIAEMVEILQDATKIEGDLSGETVDSLMPLSAEDSVIHPPKDAPKKGETRKASASDIGEVSFLAALLGHAFPSALIAQLGGFDPETIDDLIDDRDDLFEEVQYSANMGTWIYRFKRGTWKEAILARFQDEPGQDRARRVGMFMERTLVPQGYGFGPKVAHIYAENGAPKRAEVLRSLQLSKDSPDAWGLAFDFTKYFDEIAWPAPLRRSVFQHLLERLSDGRTDPQAVENLHSEATRWAQDNDDRDLGAWLMYCGSKLDLQRKDLFRARERAQDAIKLYTALENPLRAAEIHNHVAMIDLQDGRPKEALASIDQALKTGKVDLPDGKAGVHPSVFATSSHLRGMITRQSRTPEDMEKAIGLFQQANEAAAQAGLGSVALESGLAYGETLLAAGRHKEAKQALERIAQVCQNMRRPQHERAAVELLVQAEASLNNREAALKLAHRVVQLSQELKQDARMPLDLYQLGVMFMLNEKHDDALKVFQQVQPHLSSVPEKHPMKRDFPFSMGMAMIETGKPKEGIQLLEQALPLFREGPDPRRFISALEQIGVAHAKMGNKDDARKVWRQAESVAEQANVQPAVKNIQKRLKRL